MGQPQFTCYEGEPLWILHPSQSAIIASFQPHKDGVTLVQFRMRDGKLVNTAVAYNTICKLPDPYTTRDIVTAARLLV